MKNGKAIDWQARLERLEADVREIKSLLQAQLQSKEPWWKSVVGSFANDPIAAEVRKLTDERREKERQRARRRGAKAKKKTAGA